ncbi:MAG: septum formation initiator family protein [Muribaculaceae bacterium]|nr:septum formation initiator family protein [Muribaculaceae bacterium]
MNKFFAWCKRYLSLTLLATLVVGAAVLFFNDNSLLRTVEQERRIDELQASIKDATDTLEYYQNLNRSLDTDKETMERIVREQYHMQHPDEDVYVFEQ